MRQAQDLHRLSARALGPPTRTQREVKGDRLSAHPPGPLPELLQDFAAAPAARRATSEQRRGRVTVHSSPCIVKAGPLN